MILTWKYVASMPLYSSNLKETAISLSKCVNTDEDLVEVGKCIFPPRRSNRDRNSCPIDIIAEVGIDKYCYNSTNAISAFCDDGTCYCTFDATSLEKRSCDIYMHVMKLTFLSIPVIVTG